MPEFKTTRHVSHSADRMFDLVAYVERYPEFLPLCEALTVRSSREKDGKTLLIADMTVGYKGIRESFTTQVLLNQAERKIDVSYVDGPFRFLDNRWRFEPEGEGACAIQFYINYEFKNRILGAMMGSMFERAFRKFSEAFEARADEIYA
ncbi:MAG: ubiquinone-binding protein [Martelella sp.]|uniref:type II toxin-antitoxin system RatA family toxin n=1 Tax=unclassified Martelella TaxID=2629616 RepID=UPI000C5F112E|nr:type II toxin-antitoxin system RatA family toxin [Martelella sp.]MAU23466.1 ubiquinone-binding protein [Martelella sp.]|tara:strand:- start:173 stop:619 length:447 start_codon:yes stop_codon:yes gene_type:complete